MEIDAGNDITALVGAVTREVVEREHEGQAARVVRATRSYETTADDLWDAITNPDRLPRWFLPVYGDLQVGGRYQLEGNAEGEILSCEPPRSLYVTWEFGGQMSWVSVRLSAEGDGDGDRTTAFYTGDGGEPGPDPGDS